MALEKTLNATPLTGTLPISFYDVFQDQVMENLCKNISDDEIKKMELLKGVEEDDESSEDETESNVSIFFLGNFSEWKIS